MDITVQQVELLSDDDYIYLDVRGEIAYQHGHIPKAYEWAGDFSHIEELPKDKRLIVYCNYGEKSAPIAEQLRQEGYEALNLSGGYREWLLHVTSQKEQMQDVSNDGLHLFSLNDAVPEEHKSGIDMSRDLLRRSHVLVVCGHSMTESMKNDIAVAQRLGITATTLEGILTVKGQGRR